MTPLERMGGKEVARRLCDRFYRLMDERPEYASIRAFHPPDLAASRTKFLAFLLDWLASPTLYQGYAHPVLRRVHRPFRIDADLASQWLMCMKQALEDEVEPSFRKELLGAFEEIADLLILD